jgi:hypothetical protein
LLPADDDRSFSNALEVGARYRITPLWGIDVLLGATGNSGYKGDIFIPSRSFEYAVQGKVGAAYEIYKSENTSINLIGQAGAISAQKTIQSDLDNSWLKYDAMTIVGFVGVEPSVRFSENLSFFTKIGLGVMQLPSSRSAQNGWAITNGDATNIVGIDGFCIGLRYDFDQNTTASGTAKDDDINKFYDQALACIKKDDYRGVLKYSDKIIKMNPGFSMAYWSRGFAYMMLKDYPKSCSDFNQYLRLSPTIEEKDATQVKEWLSQMGCASN